MKNMILLLVALISISCSKKQAAKSTKANNPSVNQNLTTQPVGNVSDPTGLCPTGQAACKSSCALNSMDYNSALDSCVACASGYTFVSDSSGGSCQLSSTNNPAQVVSFTLINTLTDQPVAGYDPIVNTQIDLGTIPKYFSIRANLTGAAPGSVAFDINNIVNFNIENNAPYSLFRDGSGHYNPWWNPLPAAGSYTISARAYSLSGASGTYSTPYSLTLTFTGSANEYVGVPEEQSGSLVIEAESLPSAAWQKETSLTGFSGSGYYIWRSTAASSGGTGILRYVFKINNPGTYAFNFNSYANSNTENSAYFRINSGSWKKVYTPTLGMWNSTSYFDTDINTSKIQFSAAGYYIIEISARSANYGFDKFTLVKQ